MFRFVSKRDSDAPSNGWKACKRTDYRRTYPYLGQKQVTRTGLPEGDLIPECAETGHNVCFPV